MFQGPMHGEMWATHGIHHRGHDFHWAHVAIVGYMKDGRAAVLVRDGHALLINPDWLKAEQREQIKDPMVVRRYRRLTEAFQVKGTPQAELEALVKKFATPGTTVRYRKGKKPASAIDLPRKGKAEFPKMRYGRAVR